MVRVAHLLEPSPMLYGGRFYASDDWKLRENSSGSGAGWHENENSGHEASSVGGVVLFAERDISGVLC